jgi:hypothetical protein
MRRDTQELLLSLAVAVLTILFAGLAFRYVL